VLDTCVVPDKCDLAVGTFVSPEFTVTKDYVNLLIAGGTHPLGTSGPTVVAISKTSRSQRSTTAVRMPRPKLGPDSRGIAQVAAESVHERAGEVVGRSIPASPENSWNDLG